MNRFFAVLFSIGWMGVCTVPAWAQQIEWTRQFGSSNRDFALGVSVSPSGVYVAGEAGGTLPGQTSAGGDDAYVRKYDLDGNEVWTRQFGTSSYDAADAVSVDASGVYVAGGTFGSLPGQTSAGSDDAYVRKYDLDGNEVWTRQFGTVSADWAVGVAVDPSGVYVAGFTIGTLPGQTSAGYFDAYVRKYDLDGNEVWTRQFGTSDSDDAFGVSVDASGVYVAGGTFGSLPGQTSAGGDDAYVRKYDLDGNEAWTRQFGTSDSDDARGVSVDAVGVYVAGDTLGTLPGQTSEGGLDAFVRRYDLDGDEVWTRQFGTSIGDIALGVSVDAAGVYVAGWANGTLPGQTSAGGLDAYARKYTLDGDEVWTRQFGTSNSEAALGISADASGVYVAGDTTGTLPGQTTAGNQDAFVVKLSAPTPADLLQELIAAVMALNLKQGISNSLDGKLEAVVQALEDVNQSNNVAAVNALQAFIAAVEAQRGININETDADSLIAACEQIIALLGGGL